MEFCYAAIALGIGAFMLLAPDLSWELTSFHHEVQGVRSYRTDLWDCGNMLAGMMFVAFGILFLYFGFSNTNNEESETRATSISFSDPSWATRSARSTQRALTPSPTPRPDEVGRVVRVIDGDTIEVEISGAFYLVRYLGINAPALGTACGDQAAVANAALVEGQTVELYQDVSDTDLEQRLLRYVYVDETFINGELVRAGFANAVDVPPDYQHTHELTTMMYDAQREQRGCVHLP